jgi:hypothetical protein
MCWMLMCVGGGAGRESGVVFDCLYAFVGA